MTEFNEETLQNELQEIAGIRPSQKAAERAVAKVRKLLTEKQDKGESLITDVLKMVITSRISKVAAVVIFVLLVGRYLFLPSTESTALAQIFENIKKVKWVHISPDSYYDLWKRVDANVTAMKGKAGEAYFVEWDKEKGYYYNPDSNTVTIMNLWEIIREAGELIDAFSPDDELGWDRLRKKIEKYDERMESTGQIEYELIETRDAHQGKEVLVYSFKTPKIEFPSHKIKVSYQREIWTADAKTLLPLTWKCHWRPTSSWIQRYDYSINGPENIYELGVPKNAKIINKYEPLDEEVVKLAEKCRQEHEKRYRRYAAVMIEFQYDVQSKSELPRRFLVEFRDGDLCRQELYEWNIEKSKVRKNWPKYEKMMGDRFESALNWLDTTHALRIDRAQVFDGIYYYYVQGNELKALLRPNHWIRFDLKNRAAREWYHFQSHKIITEDEYSKKENLICVRRTTGNDARYYINPERGYICQRHPSSEVKSYSRTDSGNWYPKAFKWNRDLHILYLQGDPEFGERVFSFDPSHYFDVSASFVKEGGGIEKKWIDRAELKSEEKKTKEQMRRDIFIEAASNGRIKAVKKMIEEGIDKDVISAGLRNAVLCREVEMVEVLITEGADVNYRSHGKTPLHMTAYMMSEYSQKIVDKYKQIARLLVEAGANVNVKSNGNTPLLSATNAGIMNNEESVGWFVRLLAEHSADLDYRRSDQCNNALLFAAEQHSYEVVKALLEAGANPFVDTRMWEYKTILDFATDEKMIQLIMKYMRPRLLEERKSIEEPVKRFVQALRANDKKVLDELTVHGPDSLPPWQRRIRKLRERYEGNFEMLDNIRAVKFLRKIAVVYFALPDSKEYLCLVLVKWPDGKWKVMYYHYERKLPKTDLYYGTDRFYDLMDIDDYISRVYKDSGETQREK